MRVGFGQVEAALQAVPFKPSSPAELCQALARASEAGERLGGVDLSALSNLVEYAPEDMVITVEGGILLGELQRIAAKSGQWLPLDPPGADKLTIEELIQWNWSGPRRFGHGTVREHLLGLKTAMADGTIVKSGGKVVKNVAGYDLCKLFTGSRRTLGIVTEATFKVLPVPEKSVLVSAGCPNLAEVAQRLDAVMCGPWVPVAIELANVGPTGRVQSGWRVLVGFEGFAEDVDWQLGEARKAGFEEHAGGFDYQDAFWSEGFESEFGPVQTVSTEPGRVCEVLKGVLPGKPVAARAGNGIVYVRDGAVPRRNPAENPVALRIKEAFDPKGVFAPLNF